MTTLEVMEALELPSIELELQELEPLEAPGFWSGVKKGFVAGAAVVGVYGAGIAIGVAISST